MSFMLGAGVYMRYHSKKRSPTFAQTGSHIASFTLRCNVLVALLNHAPKANRKEWNWVDFRKLWISSPNNADIIRALIIIPMVTSENSKYIIWTADYLLSLNCDGSLQTPNGLEAPHQTRRLKRFERKEETCQAALLGQTLIRVHDRQSNTSWLNPNTNPQMASALDHVIFGSL